MTEHSLNLHLHADNLTQEHSFTEWPRLEGTSKITNLQPPRNRQGHQPPHLILDQAAQGPIQPGLERLQGQGIHSPSGQPVPARHHITPFLSLKTLPIIKLKDQKEKKKIKLFELFNIYIKTKWAMQYKEK